MTEAAPPSPAKYLLREVSPAAKEFYRRLGAGELATTRCERCARTGFPPRLRCPDCGTASAWVRLPGDGRLYAFTTQETALWFGAPAVLALAELGEVTVPGVMFARYDELRIGQPVSVEPFVEPKTGLSLVSFRAGA